MNKVNNIPDAFLLDDETECLLSAASLVSCFSIRASQVSHAKLNRLHHALVSKKISSYGLVSGVYGFGGAAEQFKQFITRAARINKLEPHADSDAFRKDAFAREISAAGEVGMRRGELKRLLGFLDSIASECAGVASYDALVNWGSAVFLGESLFAPADRERYAEGPLHLWDLA